MTVNIKRSEWLRGEEGKKGLNSKLFRSSDGKRCCFGFFANACGIPDQDISDVPTLAGLRKTLLLSNFSFLEKLIFVNNKVVVNTNEALSIMRLNDSVDIEESEREQKIKAEFERLGITVNFV